MIARYVAKADKQEIRIEQITSGRRVTTDERSRLQSELDAAFRTLERKAEEESADLAATADTLETTVNLQSQ